MKLQAPSPKLQRSTKHQAPRPNFYFRVLWFLVFGISLVLGAWNLELPTR
jgi:hypothetical protein